MPPPHENSFSEATKRYMALPQGKYYTPEQANITADDTKLARMGADGITSANSTIPCLGCTGIETCTGIAVYNTKTKKLATAHEIYMKGDTFSTLLKRVRDNETDQVHVHIVGGRLGELGGKDFTILPTNNLVETIDNAPNVTIKTFDMLNKSFPSAFAVDSRNGRLIRGTSDMTPDMRPLAELENFYMDGYSSFTDHFDGTTHEFSSNKDKRL